MSDFIEVHGLISDEAEDELAEALSLLPVLGADLGEDGAGWKKVGVWIHAGDDSLTERVRTILEGLGCTSVTTREHAADDWSASWRESLSAFEIGERWWIDPHSDRTTGAPEGRIGLAVEPRAAFGSGTHESTRLVLIQLERMSCRALDVLDIGTGSGVLAVAADALGAASVVAVDIDPIAAWEARSTAMGQTWSCRPRVIAGGIQCLGSVRFDLVFCNMILTRFSPLLPDIGRLLATDGEVIFSGILEGERSRLESMLDDGGLTIVSDARLGEWISVRAKSAGSVR